MKILFTLTYYLPYISGLTLHVAEIAKQLGKLNYTPTVLTSQHLKGLPAREKINGVEVIRVPYLFRLSKSFFMPDYFKKSLIEVKRADVVIVNLPQPEALITCILARIFKKRLICFYHCDVCLPPGIVNFLIEKMLVVFNLLSLALAEKILTNSEDYARHSILLPYFQSKIKATYPPIPLLENDLKFQNGLREKIPQGYSYLIGVASRIASEKGIEYLLEAIPVLRQKIGDNFLIVFAGPSDPVGEEQYRQKMLPLINKYKNKLVFLGKLPLGKMGSFYSLLDVLVLSSINSTETFGMVQVEAMLNGVPVVATDLPGVRVPIQKTGMGKIVLPKDSTRLAEAISEVLINKRKYQKDKTKISDEFSLKKTIKVYEDAINSNL